jgi:hypothetical protein
MNYLQTIHMVPGALVFEEEEGEYLHGRLTGGCRLTTTGLELEVSWGDPAIPNTFEGAGSLYSKEE